MKRSLLFAGVIACVVVLSLPAFGDVFAVAGVIVRQWRPTDSVQ